MVTLTLPVRMEWLSTCSPGDKQTTSESSARGNFGIWLDEDLCHGRSQSCETFANPRLSKEGDFVVTAIECWTFV